MNAARWLNMGVLAVILLAFCLQAFLALPRLSATTDEPVHLAAGYSYWTMRDFRLNPEHPPLAKLIAALPLLFIHPKLDTTHDDWDKAAEYPVGFNFLYNNDADRLLFWSRAAMVGIAAIGLLVTFLWARDLFGTPSGLLAAGMYAFSPNLLAHGMLVTTDVPLAVFTVLTLYLFWKQRNFQTGLALGAAMASKYSGAFLPILITAVCIARDRRSAVKRLPVIAAASLLVISAAFLFSESPLLYFRNASLVNANHLEHYPFYLLGSMKEGGWWYYFLAAFAVKATIPTLMLIFAATLDAATGLKDRWGEIILVMAVVFYIVVISIGADQIGVRYLLPIFPLLFVWTSRVVPRLVTKKVGIAAIGVVLFGQAWTSLQAFPNYIPYFNEAAGGSQRGPSLLDDSNVDWGQGVKLAAEYARTHHLENVNIYTFSPFDNPPYYGLPPNIAPSQAFQRLVINRPTRGIYIISAHYVARIMAANPVWTQYKPLDRIGESLLVYEF